MEVGVRHVRFAVRNLPVNASKRLLQPTNLANVEWRTLGAFFFAAERR
jgi:hypothetical protein